LNGVSVAAIVEQFPRPGRMTRHEALTVPVENKYAGVTTRKLAVGVRL